jgi:hypothetical protein
MANDTTAQTDAAAEATAQMKAAQDDLVALQAFQAIATNPASTIGQLEAGQQALLASIGDPARLAAVQGAMGGYASFLNQLNNIVGMTTTAATSQSS